MVAVKQYLENSWYRGASQDRQTGYAGQYQYGYGVNTRDMKNGVCLAGGGTFMRSFNTGINVFTAFGNAYYINGTGTIYNMSGTVMANTEVTDQYAPICEEFGNTLFVIGDNAVKMVSSSGTVVNITEAFPEFHGHKYRGMGQCALNFANTFLLIGDDNVLWRVDGNLGIIKGIRIFHSGYRIYGLTQEGNYLKIYTSNGVNTKIHYAKGTFDMEDTGLVQTITYPGLAINIGDVAADQGRDYVMFRQSERAAGGSYKLAKVQGYSKIDIRWTQTRGGQTIFTADDPAVYASDGVVFAGMKDGVWTFTEYNGWLWGGCCEFPTTGGQVTSMVKYGETLYVVVKFLNDYELFRYDMSFHPSLYQQNGFIIGRVFDGGSAGLFKKNVQTTVTYNMPENTSMELSYRYDRSAFDYASGFLQVKELEDTATCYDIIVPTTDNNFNWTRNLLEYRFDLHGDGYSTPILFEHSLLYNDSIRKYR